MHHSLILSLDLPAISAIKRIFHQFVCILTNVDLTHFTVLFHSRGKVLPELNTLDWRERTEFPLGMDGEGVFFAVDGLQDQQPR